MSNLAERKFRDRVQPKLDKIPNSWWESISQKSVRGTPDVIGVINGTFIALEFKSDDGIVAPIQQFKINKIIKAGGAACVLRPSNWDEAYEKLLHLGECKHDHTDVQISKQ